MSPRCSVRGVRWFTAIRGTTAGTGRGDPVSRSAAGAGASGGIRGTIPGTARGGRGIVRGTIPGTVPDGVGAPDGTAEDIIITDPAGGRVGAADTDRTVLRRS